MSLLYSPLEALANWMNFFAGEMMIQEIEFSIHLGPVGVHPGLDFPDEDIIASGG